MDFSDDIPDDMLAAAAAVVDKLYPDKSRNRYHDEFQKLEKWLAERKIKSYSEPVLLVYFQSLHEKFAPTTVQSHHSMVKSVLKIEHNLDIGQYEKLNALMKRKFEGYQVKKAEVFTPEDLKNFFENAPDQEFLAVKVVASFGICGACRTDELVNLTVKNVKDYNGIFRVNLEHTKNKQPRFFTISEQFYHVVKQYVNMRPPNVPSDRFFVNYQKGKCTNQVIGRNKFQGMPKQIATYLNLPNPESYTGHSFRRSSATIVADSGVDITTLKRHTGHKSTKVCEGYIQESVAQKRKMGTAISSAIFSEDITPHDVKNPSTLLPKKPCTSTSDETKNTVELPANLPLSINLSNCSNVTFVMKE